jgi:hypothetical protein
MTEKDVQELLKPRYKAISPNENHYPGSFWKIGDIIDPTGRHTQFDKYPHLFRKLEWWEERKPEEMPLYVKDKYNQVHKVVYAAKLGADLEKGYSCSWNMLEPATEQEYVTYKQSQK